VPASTVEHEAGRGIGRQGGGKLRQKQVHHCGIDDRQHQSEILAGGRADREGRLPRATDPALSVEASAAALAF
jgi:hypothetical protein